VFPNLRSALSGKKEGSGKLSRGKKRGVGFVMRSFTMFLEAKAELQAQDNRPRVATNDNTDPNRLFIYHDLAVSLLISATAKMRRF